MPVHPTGEPVSSANYPAAEPVLLTIGGSGVLSCRAIAEKEFDTLLRLLGPPSERQRTDVKRATDIVLVEEGKLIYWPRTGEVFATLPMPWRACERRSHEHCRPQARAGLAPQLARRAWVERFTSWGFAVLRLDSLGPRAKTCNSSGDLPSFDRAVDAYSAKEWLSQRPEIDPDRIILAGWSHGGAAVLAALGSPPSLFGARKGTKPFVAGIAFYPDCFTPNEVQAPVLILIGDADTWSPVNLCRQMQEHPKIRLMVYPGAYQGFDIPGADI